VDSGESHRRPASRRLLASPRERYPWAPADMMEVLGWRHPSFYLAFGWPLYLDIEEKFLDVAPKEAAPGARADADPVTHLRDGTPLKETSRRETARIRSVQRAASAAAVEVLHALAFSVTQPMLRGFLHRIAFSPDPLNPASDLVSQTIEKVAAKAEPGLVAKLPFSVEDALNPPQDVLNMDWPRGAPVVDRIRMPFDHKGKPIPSHIWANGVEALVRTRLAHERLLAVREEFVRLARRRRTPSPDYFQARLDIRTRIALAGQGERGGDVLDTVVGGAAAESSPWWREKLEWHLLRGDNALKPRGSYASPDDAPKQLFIWQQFDHWTRKGLGDLPTHLDRSRAIAATLMVFAGPALYHPPDLEQFTRNIVERWRTCKAPSANALERGLFMSVAGFAFTSPRQAK
jgi:hypothetical protein